MTEQPNDSIVADSTYSPTFDEDGYPTEETLERIRSWPINDDSGPLELLQYVRDAWYYPDRFFELDAPPDDYPDLMRNICGPRRWFYVSTAGWSGNESLIEALQHNVIFWMLCWWSSRRGGHYIFEVRDR